ncbi:hypothetical protein MD273_03345 [Marinobacter pelagius]|uniref:hypothetical protein n=1 Tax=Marinobacter sp. C7 TaxID=2951363 RepID=UPI001EF06407|nr:hypothetical protein [Marinobacter sp. C7]MCG7198755.1 hypothetical protein [Marinobacter sp. C7]
MTGSERVRFLVIVSAEPDQIPAASEQIARQLSKQFGGATILGGNDLPSVTGYWAEDGHAFKNTYSGTIHKEPVFAVMLMVVPEDEERAFLEIQSAVKQAVSDFGLRSRHIHVEVSSVRSRHFDVCDTES